jgi:hypothetical protein
MSNEIQKVGYIKDDGEIILVPSAYSVEYGFMR